jgi:hypothetical protein
MKLRVQVRTRRQWDRYCLWLALGGGNLAGIIWILPALSMALGSSLWAHVRHHDFRYAGSLLLFFVILWLARVPRRRLFWVFVPSALWLAWSVTDQAVLGNWPGLVRDLRSNVMEAGVYLVTATLLELLMGGFGQGLEEEEDVPEAASAMQFDSQEGVWPPAPNYPPQPLGRKED